MKTICVFLLLTLFAGDPRVYPLRVRIVHIEEAHNLKWGSHSGHGVGNIREEDGTLHGMDFEFEGCEQGIKASVGPLWYLARLKKPGRLAVGAQEIGSDKITECEFKYTPRDFRYVIKNGHVSTEPAKNVPLKDSVAE